MREEGLCHHCAFWNTYLETHQGRFEVVDGKVYEYGNPLFIIKSRTLPAKTAYIFKSDNTALRLPFARCIGKAPEGYGLSNTGKFITRPKYLKISNREGYECRAVGCFDRYHCFWYNKEKWEPDGPWNIVPKNHVVGSEECPNFVDKSAL